MKPLLHHEIGTHVVTYQNGARQPLTLLTVGLPGYDETEEGLAVLAEYLTGELDPRRLRVLAARVLAIGKMLDGAGFLQIFESLRNEHRIPVRTAWSIAIRVVLDYSIVIPHRLVLPLCFCCSETFSRGLFGGAVDGSGYADGSRPTCVWSSRISVCG